MKQLVAIMERLLPTGVILDGQKSQGMNPERVTRMGCGVERHCSVRVGGFNEIL